MLSGIKRFVDAAPDWLYAFLAIPYWALHPHRERILVFPQGGCWLVRKGDNRFFVPDPGRGQQPLNPKSEYERYFEIDYNDTVFDIGACIGEFTIPAARKGKTVVAIEPEPRNLISLRANIAESKVSNVQVIERGISNREGLFRLWLGSSGAIGSHSLKSNLGSKELISMSSRGESIDIPVSTLDNIFLGLEIDKIDFMKMNVNGAELEALEGAEKTLKVTEKIVVVTHYFRDRRGTLPQVQRFLKKHGFEIRVTDGKLV